MCFAIDVLHILHDVGCPGVSSGNVGLNLVCYSVLLSVSSPALLTHLLPVAHDGTSQDGTDEGGIVGDNGGASSRWDITGGDDADDGANTSAECMDNEDDHTLSSSQSSEHAVCMDV